MAKHGLILLALVLGACSAGAGQQKPDDSDQPQDDGTAGSTGTGGSAGVGGSTSAKAGTDCSVTDDYRTVGPFHGNSFALVDASSACTNVGYAGMSICGKGEVQPKADWSSFGLVGLNINQSRSGSVSTWTPPSGSTGLIVKVTNNGSAEVRLQIQAKNDPDSRWCYVLSTFGYVEVPWASFNTKCWDGSGSAYNGQALETISLAMPGDNKSVRSYDVCLDEVIVNTSGSVGTGGSQNTGGSPNPGGSTGSGGSSSTGGAHAIVGDSTDESAMQIAAGSTHSCVILKGGTVGCWGYNNHGQLGNGTTTDSKTLVTVSGLEHAKEIGVGLEYSCALIADGTVKCWGVNGSGELGDTSTTDRKVPVVVAGVSGATSIGCGHLSSCAVLESGTVMCWGTTGPLGDDNFGSRPTAKSVPGLTGVVKMSVGTSMESHCALLSDGTAKCWGGNASGEVGDGTQEGHLSPVAVSGLSGIRQIDIAESKTCAVLSDGTVMCWGDNGEGVVGSGSADQGTHLRPTKIAGIANAVQVGIGYSHACAIQGSDGSVKCWGESTSYQMGTGESKYGTFSPVLVPGVSDVRQLSVDDYNVLVLKRNGEVLYWGANVKNPTTLTF